MTEALRLEDRVPLTKLAAELGVNRKTVSRWADEGYQGRRLESYRIGKKRFSTRGAAERFIAAVSGEPAGRHRGQTQRRQPARRRPSRAK